MKIGIYKITNLVNGKFYIGSSKNIEHRWNEHKQYLRGGYHDNSKLQNAWNFYGEDKFKFEIIEEVQSDEQLLLEREQYHLDLWRPYERLIGYNICSSAFGGDTLTHHPDGNKIKKEWSEKYKSLYVGEGNPMFGLKHSDKSIKLQKEKSVGRYTMDWFILRHGGIQGKKKFDERRMMLANRKMNYSYPNPLKGKKRGPMSEEIKKRISERKAKLKIIRVDLHKDILSNKHGMSELAKKYGVSISTVKNEKNRLKINQ